MTSPWRRTPPAPHERLAPGHRRRASVAVAIVLLAIVAPSLPHMPSPIGIDLTLRVVLRPADGSWRWHWGEAIGKDAQHIARPNQADRP